jgi:two-component system sensor histidine kinase VanS
MKISDKITITAALTLFFVIFITAFSFTQLFLINNRNTQLSNLAGQNNKFIEYTKNNFDDQNKVIKYLQESDYMLKMESISGVNMLIANQDLNILINSLNTGNEDPNKLALSSDQIKSFFTENEILTISSNNDFDKLIYSQISDSQYFISIREFQINSQSLVSIFLKKQDEIVLPPFSYAIDMLLIFLIAGLISIITGLLLGRNISGPIMRLSKSVGRISNGDYTENITVRGSDEISILANNINNMKNKIQRSQDSLKEFTYMLSHEIKNIITSVNGYAVGISEGVYSTEDEINEALNIIKSKTKDLENITESLLMLSRVENRLIELEKKEIKIEYIIDDLIKLYEPELARNRLTIKKTYSIKAGTKLMSDKYLVQTVISNLVNNAMKYSSPDSEIIVEVTSSQKNVAFSVSNSGFGITGDEKDKIFNMFYRSKKYEFKNIKGFGLGLAISKRIANILGAGLDFESAGNINTFIFRIPIA